MNKTFIFYGKGTAHNESNLLLEREEKMKEKKEDLTRH